jgi:hypothetical protein
VEINQVLIFVREPPTVVVVAVSLLSVLALVSRLRKDLGSLGIQDIRLSSLVLFLVIRCHTPIKVTVVARLPAITRPAFKIWVQFHVVFGLISFLLFIILYNPLRIAWIVQLCKTDWPT